MKRHYYGKRRKSVDNPMLLLSGVSKKMTGVCMFRIQVAGSLKRVT